jgi:signal transduction histidine kinase
MQEAPDSELAGLLLGLGRTVVLRLTHALEIQAVHNTLLLTEWREASMPRADMPSSLKPLLDELLAPARSRDLAGRIASDAASVGPAGLYLGVYPLLAPRGGGALRHVAISLHGSSGGDAVLLVLRDVSAMNDVQQTLADTQLALDSAMAALRAPPRALRMFLGSALTSISAIRATLRLPARDAEALRDKLARVHAATAQLAGEAATLNLTPIQDACQVLLHRLDALLTQDELSGDALLPLAGLVDRIAATAGTLWRIEEQRHVEPQPERDRTVRRQTDWTYASHRRWASFVRNRGKEVGVLVAFEMQGAVHVPKNLRVAVDDLLQHILRNAVEHGIEPPEERLAAGKPAHATVAVRFEPLGDDQLRMTVRDDGRGRGLGLTFLRRAVARLGGVIAVAAKPDQYTQFVIDLARDVQHRSSQAAAQ